MAYRSLFLTPLRYRHMRMRADDREIRAGSRHRIGRVTREVRVGVQVELEVLRLVTNPAVLAVLQRGLDVAHQSMEL